VFSFTDHDADDTVLSAPLDGVAEQMAYAEGVRDTLRLSRQSEARTVLGAGMIGDRAYNDRMNGQGPHANSGSHTKAHKFAIGEISLQLGITRGKAGEWASLAHMLADLPKIRLAYLAGDFSTHRVTELATSSQTAPKGNLRPRLNDILDEALGPRPTPTTTDDEPATDGQTGAHDDASTDDTDTGDDPGSTDDTVDEKTPEDPADAPVDFEDIALELAYRPTPDTVLRDELDSALISLDPDAHAQAREDVAQAFQNVTFAKEAFGHMQMSACLSAEHAIHLQHRIADLIAERVCRRDPRRVGHRRAIALAEIHSVPDVRLECACGYDTCTARTRKQAANATPSAAVDDNKVTPETTATHGPTMPATTTPETTTPETTPPETTPPETTSAEATSAEATSAEAPREQPGIDEAGVGEDSARGCEIRVGDAESCTGDTVLTDETALEPSSRDGSAADCSRAGNSDDVTSPTAEPSPCDDPRGRRAECRRPEPVEALGRDGTPVHDPLGARPSGTHPETATPILTCPETLAVGDALRARLRRAHAGLCRPSATPRAGVMYLYRDRRCRHP
jgi:hypothetical protein